MSFVAYIFNGNCAHGLDSGAPTARVGPAIRHCTSLFPLPSFPPIPASLLLPPSLRDPCRVHATALREFSPAVLLSRSLRGARAATVDAVPRPLNAHLVYIILYYIILNQASPVTAALWASEPLPPCAPLSMYFLALSHAPPALSSTMAISRPVRLPCECILCCYHCILVVAVSDGHEQARQAAVHNITYICMMFGPPYRIA